MGSGGGGAAFIPFGGAGETTTSGAQKSTGDTDDLARTALLLEQAVAQRLANRRREFDEVLYERDKTPTAEQELFTRSRGNPPPSEVQSGQALNALLDDLRASGASSSATARPDAPLPLDQQGLKHINVTRGAGSSALLKDGGRLRWPAALKGAPFQPTEDRLESLVKDAIQQAGTTDRVEPDTLRHMAANLDQLRELLRQSAKDLSLGPYIEARAFLRQFDDAIVAFHDGDAADYFKGKYDLKAHSIRGLVNEMTDNGLRFAPAVAGDEAAYAALREALAVYDRAPDKPSALAR